MGHAQGFGFPPGVQAIYKAARADDDPVVKYKVVVQLAGEGRSGTTEILKKVTRNNGLFSWSRIDKCGSSNGFENRFQGDLAFKTPAGRYQPLDTGDKLLYQGSWDNHGPVTYYLVVQGGPRRGFAGLHNGHVPGANSHACIRTENDCARGIRRIADHEGVEVGASDAEPVSLVFGPIEETNYLQSLGIRAKRRRDFSSIVLEFLPY